MPWYDYQCEKCGSVFEVQHAMGEPGKIKCKHCCSAQTVKIYGATGVLFKGSGFYVTDSRSQNAAGTSSTTSSNGNGAGSAPAETATAPVAQPEQAAKSEPAKKP